MLQLSGIADIEAILVLVRDAEIVLGRSNVKELFLFIYKWS